MNKVILLGRLTRDPEIRYRTLGESQEKIASARYTLAVDKKTKDVNGKTQADFIQCSMLGKTAEFAEKYLKKGMKILVNGKITTGSYVNKDGQTVYTTEVSVFEHEFVESKKADGEQSVEDTESAADGFMPIPDDAEELPFA